MPPFFSLPLTTTTIRMVLSVGSVGRKVNIGLL